MASTTHDELVNFPATTSMRRLSESNSTKIAQLHPALDHLIQKEGLQTKRYFCRTKLATEKSLSEYNRLIRSYSEELRRRIKHAGSHLSNAKNNAANRDLRTLPTLVTQQKNIFERAKDLD